MKELKIKWSIIGLLVFCGIMLLSFASCNRPAKPLVIDMQPDSIKETLSPEDAVKINLQLRRDMLKQEFTDSVYKTMPTDVLIIISLQHPDMWMNEIVDEYINNKNYYDRLTEDNKRVKNYHMNNPDTLPTKSKIQKPNKEQDDKIEPVTHL